LHLDSFHGLTIQVLLNFLEFKQPEHGFKSSKIFSMKSTVIKLNNRICCAGNETGCLNGGKLNNNLHKIMMPIYSTKIQDKYTLSVQLINCIINTDFNNSE
jgi:hypothetical protein